MSVFSFSRCRCAAMYIPLICAFCFGAAADIFFDSTAAGSSFAAQEIKAALEGTGYTVAFKPLTSLSDVSAPTRFILALKSSAAASARFTSEGGAALPTLGEQAFALRKTTSGASAACWVFGGDGRGILYGGLDIAETIRLESVAAIAVRDASPRILNRGIKFNIPLDARTPGYGDASEIARDNIVNMWDMNFWHDFLDKLARDRYNVLSLWNLHPFPSMVKVPEYPNVALADVMSYTGTFSDATLTGTAMYPSAVSSNLVKVKTMTIDQKIAFWQDIMAYGKERGVDFYIFTWNIFTYGAAGKDGVTSAPGATTNDYYRKAVRSMVQTYPLLAGFGITNGENMQGQSESWLYDVYARGIMDGKAAGRSVRLIHRMHQASGISGIASAFSGYNDQLDFSFKYSAAHMYSSVHPPFLNDAGYLGQLTGSSKMWLTVRNDDFYMMRWGDPDFARAYLQNIPVSGGKIAGFYMGPDGYTWGRELISREPSNPRQIFADKQWFSFLLWGRLGYDPAIANSHFQKILGNRFPEMNSVDLLTSWAAVSRALPLVTRFHWSNSDLDYRWYPEACFSNPTTGGGNNPGFHDINLFINMTPMGPNMMDIPTHRDRIVNNQPMGSDTTPEQIGNLLNGYASTALPLIDKSDPGSNTELRFTLADIRAMAYISKYYGEKILGATDKAVVDANGNAQTRQSAIAHLQNAAMAWRTYATIIGTSYIPMHLTRMGADLVDVRALIMPKVLQDIQLAGGPAIMPSMTATAGGTILEAETAQLTSGAVKSTVTGFTGAGYADFGTAANGSVRWTVNAPTAGRYLLEFRYSLASGNASLNLDVGGTAIVPPLSCWQTGNASSWVWDQRFVNLVAGSTTVTLTANGTAPLIDHVNVVRMGNTTTANPLAMLRQAEIVLRGNRFSIKCGQLAGRTVSIRAFSMDGSLVSARNFQIGDQGSIQGDLFAPGIARGGYVAEISVGDMKFRSTILLLAR